MKYATLTALATLVATPALGEPSYSEKMNMLAGVAVTTVAAEQYCPNAKANPTAFNILWTGAGFTKADRPKLAAELPVIKRRVQLEMDLMGTGPWCSALHKKTRGFPPEQQT
jgi:hypothetical protein